MICDARRPAQEKVIQSRAWLSIARVRRRRPDPMRLYIYIYIYIYYMYVYLLHIPYLLIRSEHNISISYDPIRPDAVCRYHDDAELRRTAGTALYIYNYTIYIYVYIYIYHIYIYIHVYIYIYTYTIYYYIYIYIYICVYIYIYIYTYTVLYTIPACAVPGHISYMYAVMHGALHDKVPTRSNIYIYIYMYIYIYIYI